MRRGLAAVGQDQPSAHAIRVLAALSSCAMDRLRRKRLSLGLQPRPASSPLGLDGVDHLAPDRHRRQLPHELPQRLQQGRRPLPGRGAARPPIASAASRAPPPAPMSTRRRRHTMCSGRSCPRHTPRSCAVTRPAPRTSGPFSRASTTLSGSSAYSLDWRSQPVERQGPLDPRPQSLRGRAGYLVTTPDYLVVLKSRADAVAAFPQLAAAGGTRPGFASPPPEPVHVIPVRLVVAVFSAESSRPSFGIEVWWRSAFPAIAFRSVQPLLQPAGHETRPAEAHPRLGQGEGQGRSRRFQGGPEVEDCIRRLLRSEEPRHALSEPEIFPVAFRTTPPREGSSKTDDRPKKAAEGTSYYLAVGINMCFFVEIPRASAVPGAASQGQLPGLRPRRARLVLRRVGQHEERFVLTFRQVTNALLSPCRGDPRATCADTSAETRSRHPSSWSWPAATTSRSSSRL